MSLFFCKGMAASFPSEAVGNQSPPSGFRVAENARLSAGLSRSPWFSPTLSQRPRYDYALSERASRKYCRRTKNSSTSCCSPWSSGYKTIPYERLHLPTQHQVRPEPLPTPASTARARQAISWAFLCTFPCSRPPPAVFPKDPAGCDLPLAQTVLG